MKLLPLNLFRYESRTKIRLPVTSTFICLGPCVSDRIIDPTSSQQKNGDPFDVIGHEIKDGIAVNHGSDECMLLNACNSDSHSESNYDTDLDLTSLDPEELLSSCSKSVLRKSVSFAKVEVREYTVTIGDHPYCVNGCPLSLDWDYSLCKSVSLDTYEALHPPRRHGHELRTTWEERCNILCQGNGCTQGEIRRANRKLHRARSCDSKLCDKASALFFKNC